MVPVGPLQGPLQREGHQLLEDRRESEPREELPPSSPQRLHLQRGGPHRDQGLLRRGRVLHEGQLGRMGAVESLLSALWRKASAPQDEILQTGLQRLQTYHWSSEDEGGLLREASGGLPLAARRRAEPGGPAVPQRPSLHLNPLLSHTLFRVHYESISWKQCSRLYLIPETEF